MDAQTSHAEPLTYSIKDACRVTSIGRTKLYELIGTGELATIHVGGRRLVKGESLRRLTGTQAAA